MLHFCRALTVLIVLVVGGAFAAQAQAAEYYVSPSGNDSNPGTIDRPFRTVKGNIWRMNPGDTMYLRGGTYLNDLINVPRSGEPNRPITFKAYQNEKPVLANIPGPTQAIYVYNKSHVIFDGINIDNVDGHWVSIWLSNNITVKNCQLTNVSRNIIGFYIINSNRITVQNCSMDRNGANTTQDKDLIYVENTHYSLFENLVLTRGQHSLIGLSNSTYNVIRNNILHNEWQKNIGIAAPANQTALGRNLVENNLIYGSRPAVARGFEGKGAMGIYVNQKGNIIRRNRIYDNDNFGILVDGNNSLGNSAVNFNKIYHNVLFKNGLAKRYTEGGGLITTDFRMRLNMGRNTFKNNILSLNEPWNAYISSLAGLFDGNTYQGNCFYSLDSTRNLKIEGLPQNSLAWFAQNYPTEFANNVEGNPRFLNDSINAPDFNLGDGSACLEKGVPLTRTTSAGSGRQITVEDASYFTDGFGIVDGDMIQVGNNQPVKITAIDYIGQRITVDRDLTWQANQGVSQPFTGAAPEPGVYESAARAPAPTPGTSAAPSAAPASPSPRPTGIPGDANQDRKVDGLDYVIWLQNAGSNLPVSTNGAYRADFNNDGLVNDQDYLIWLQNYRP